MKNSLYNKIEFDKARRPDPRTLYELRGAYNVQNCCIASVDFPDYYFQDHCGNGDTVQISMSDRVPYEWNKRARERIMALRRERGSDLESMIFGDMEPEELKAYATAFFDTEPVDGMRVVEYTNSSDGYPVYIISAYKKGDGTPEPAYEYEVNFTGKPPEASRAPKNMNNVKIIAWEHRYVIECSGLEFTQQMNNHVQNALSKLPIVNDVGDAPDYKTFTVYCDGANNSAEMQQKLTNAVKQACDEYLKTHPHEPTMN